MRIVPHSRLEAFAREQYQKHYGAAPPKVRNATALVALGEPRPLRWRGHAYTIPALSFSAGARLLVAVQVLADPASSQHAHALHRARRELHAIVRTRAGRKPWRNPFRSLLRNEAVELLRSVLYVPDDVVTPPTPGMHTVDLLDGLCEFFRYFPALVNAQGLPVSWSHYQYGMRHIRRIVARDTIRHAQSARMAQMSKDAFAGFIKTYISDAGWA